jgi:hypothetical protein
LRCDLRQSIARETRGKGEVAKTTSTAAAGA